MPARDGYDRRAMHASAPSGGEQVRVAEVVAALSLACDLQLALDIEHGLRSTVFALRIGERLGVDEATLADAYYTCLLMYAGCTADVHVRAEVIGGDFETATQNVFPVIFGSSREMLGALTRSVAPGRGPLVRAAEVVRSVPRMVRVMPEIDVACREVAGLLSDRLGVPASVRALADHVDERWDGRGEPGEVQGDELPLATRIAQVARDTDMQHHLGGCERVAAVMRDRAGDAFDPAIAHLVAREAPELCARDDAASAWDEVLAGEPGRPRVLVGEEIDRALTAMGEFADLASPHLTGHSPGVAELAVAAGGHCRLDGADLAVLRRAALVHDVGRTAVPPTIWNKAGPLTPPEWERVRLHPYQTGRILHASSFLGGFADVASAHHERMDGSGYHRGTTAPGLSASARILAAADVYHAMTEPRAHRPALPAAQAADVVADEARAGRLDPDAVQAVLVAAGARPARMERPAGLTEREAAVVGMLARGMQTKQVAHALGISVKTADRHVQNAYAKIGVSTRAGATVFAMEHGLVAWADLAGRPGQRRSPGAISS